MIPGPKGEGGLDDATGAGGAGGASMKQSSGVVDLGMHPIPAIKLGSMFGIM